MRNRSVDDLLKLALSQPGGPSYLLLRFVPSADETQDLWAVSQALPWLGQLDDGRFSLFEDLRGYGMGVVVCADRQEARQRLKEIRGGRISATLFQHNRKALRRTRNPALQRLHGIYPTSPPLVGYLVRSVHRLLQARFGWSAGLADPRVRLLDPAAGSMPFLRAAWRLALEACWHQGGEPGNLLHTHLLPHFLGVELLPETHARGLANLRRFLAVYGYPPDPEASLPALLGDSLDPVAPILDFPANVVLGNPPWRGRSEPRGPWITDLLADYFQLDGQPLLERNSKWLNDDAVRFLRLAQWKIDQAGLGIAALVLPHTGLDAPTFRGLRRSLLDSFDEIYALDLHGNRGSGRAARTAERTKTSSRASLRGSPSSCWSSGRGWRNGCCARTSTAPGGTSSWPSPPPTSTPPAGRRFIPAPPPTSSPPRTNGSNGSTGAASPCRRSFPSSRPGSSPGGMGWRPPSTGTPSSRGSAGCAARPRPARGSTL